MTNTHTKKERERERERERETNNPNYYQNSKSIQYCTCTHVTHNIYTCTSHAHHMQ